MNRQEMLFWFILVQYWWYKSATFPPLPLWKIDQNIGILFLTNLYQNVHRLTRMPLPHYIFDKRTRLLVNELNGIFVCTCKDVFNSLLSRPFEFWILCRESFRSFDELLDEVSIRIPDKSRLPLANRVLPPVSDLQCTITDIWSQYVYSRPHHRILLRSTMGNCSSCDFMAFSA